MNLHMGNLEAGPTRGPQCAGGRPSNPSGARVSGPRIAAQLSNQKRRWLDQGRTGRASHFPGFSREGSRGLWAGGGRCAGRLLIVPSDDLEGQERSVVSTGQKSRHSSASG